MPDVPPDNGKTKQIEDDAREALFAAVKRIADDIKPIHGSTAVESMAHASAMMFTAALARGSDVPPDSGRKAGGGSI